MKLWPVPDHERALWQKQYVLPFILDPYESSDDKYLPSTRMARKILRKHIEEYRNAIFTGKGLCKERGIEIYYNKRGHRFSTTELRNRNEEEKTKE